MRRKGNRDGPPSPAGLSSFARGVSQRVLERAHQRRVVAADRPDVAPAKYSPTVDEERGGNPNREKGRLDTLVRVEPQRIRHLEVPSEVSNRRFLTVRVDAHADQLETLCSISLVERLEDWNLLSAGMTPGCPDVQQNDAAAHLVERYRVPRERDGPIGRRGLADLGTAYLSVVVPRAREEHDEREGTDCMGTWTGHQRSASRRARAMRIRDGVPASVQAKMRSFPRGTILGKPLARAPLVRATTADVPRVPVAATRLTRTSAS